LPCSLSQISRAFVFAESGPIACDGQRSPFHYEFQPFNRSRAIPAPASGCDLPRLHFRLITETLTDPGSNSAVFPT
jgi:hypothetical protein